jgi:hypothetical protein
MSLYLRLIHVSCSVDSLDAEAGFCAKEVNFRVEFTSLLLDGPVVRSAAPRITGQFFTKVTLIQEKGALSTFKRIHTDLKNEWT